MKKITFFTLLFFTCTIIAQKKLVTKISEYRGNTTWVSSSKNAYSYDLRGNLTKNEGYSNENGEGESVKWNLYNSTNYTYDSINKLTLETEKSYERDTLSNAYRTEYKYNEKNNLVEVVYSEWESNDWQNGDKILLNYDDDGRLKDGIYYCWDGDDWSLEIECSEKIIITYNNENKKSQVLYQEWDGENWYNYGRDLFTYSNNNLEQYLIQSWNEDTNSWSDEERSIYTYDANGNKITERSGYYDGEWNENTTTFAYDTTKLMTDYHHPFKEQTLLNFFFDEGQNYSYINKLLSETINDSRTTFFYENDEVASVKENNVLTIKVFPNPTKDNISIAGKGILNSTIELYNILGEKVFSTKRSKFSIKNFSNGMYFLKVNTMDGKVATKRIIKE